MALRIPIAFARETGIDSGAEVDLTLEDGRLVITPAPKPPHSLEALLAGITEENVHAEVETRGVRGGERW